MLWFTIALAGALFTSISSILEKSVLKKIHALQFSTAANTTILLFSVILLPFVRITLSWNVLILFVIIAVASVTSTIAFLFIAKAFRHGEISIASPLLNLSPLFLCLLATIFLKEILNSKQVYGIILIVSGAFILESKKNLRKSLLGVIKSGVSKLMISAAFLYAISSLLLRFALVKGLDPITLFIVLQFFTSLNFVFISWKRFGFGDIKKAFGIKPIAWVAVFFFLGRFFNVLAMNLAFVALAISVRRLSTLFSTIVGGMLFHEDDLIKRVMASLIMLSGAWLLSL